MMGAGGERVCTVAPIIVGATTGAAGLIAANGVGSLPTVGKETGSNAQRVINATQKQSMLGVEGPAAAETGRFDDLTSTHGMFAFVW